VSDSGLLKYVIFVLGKGNWARGCLPWVKGVSCVSDADAFHRGKGDVCMSERRYSNDPKEILERPIVDPTKI
jgi:hypothetical protein